MAFSPLKRDIILLIIRDYEMVEVNRIIQAQLNVSIEQTFYIIDYLINRKLLSFSDGELVLTDNAYETLNKRKLGNFSLNDIEKYQFSVDEKYLTNYIPKGF